jgi:hypothetical protein
MLPALRQSLHGFTRRADILLRQLSFSQATQHALLDAFEMLAAMPQEEQGTHLAAAGQHLAVLAVGFVDPDNLRLYNTERKRAVSTLAEVPEKDDGEARRRLFVQQALERAFAINNRQLYDYLVAALAGGHEIRSSSLPIRDARELLNAAHLIEVGTAGWGRSLGLSFEVRETGHRVSNEFFAGMDEFVVRVRERAHASE